MEHKIDRISELPEPILENILSFIPIKQILQLSILSKIWQNVWTLFPVPEFNQHLFTNNLRKVPPNEKQHEIQRKEEQFKNFVERTLLSRYRQRLSVNKFNLHMILDVSDCALVNHWIDYAIECNVKELNLDVRIDRKSYELSKKNYQFSERVLVAKSITELKFCGYELKSFYSDIKLPSLKKLVLSTNVENQVVQTLIDRCRDIEEMKFKCCHGLKSIKVSSLPKLMSIELQNNDELESVEIEALNLESLVIMVRRPCQINLGLCKNLKKLALYSCEITDKWLHDVLSKHPLIDTLNLANCNMLQKIKISSHHMKNLTLISCSKLAEIDIVTPNLDRLDYDGKVISFSLNSSSLSEVILYLCMGETDLNVGMIEFLAKLSQPKLLTLDPPDAESVIIAKELRETLPSPLYNVKQLKLSIPSLPTIQIDELMDAFLWICPLLEILFIEWGYEEAKDNISFKFSYRNDHIDKLENFSCCKFIPVFCWRHCLKSIKIETLRGSIEEDILMKYFWKNAKILESFHYLNEFALPKV